MVSWKTKIICSMLAGIIHNIGKDSILPINSFTVYFISYIHNFDPSITMFTAYFAQAVFILSMTSSGIIGGRIDNRFGCHM